MVLPITIDPSVPLGTQSLVGGDNELRAIKETFRDVFGLPVFPTAIGAGVMRVLGSKDLAAELVLIGSTPTNLWITENTNISTDIIIPSNVKVIHFAGGFTKTAVGKLDFRGGFRGDRTKAFTNFSLGDVKFGPAAVEEVFPEWWGIDGVEDEVEFNLAVSALPFGGKIKAARTLYKIQTNPITIATGIAIEGASPSMALLAGVDYGTVFYTTLTTSGAFRIPAGAYHTEFKSFGIRGALVSGAGSTSGRHGIEWRTTTGDPGAYGLNIEDVHFMILDSGVKVWDTTSGVGIDVQLSGVVVQRCQFNEVNQGVHFDSANGELRVGPLCYIAVQTNGSCIYLNRAGTTVIEDSFGAAAGTFGTEHFIYNNITASLRIVHCQAEQIDFFLKIPNTAPATYGIPIYLVANTVDEEISIMSARTIISIGNKFDGGDFNTDSCKIFTAGDYFLPPYKLNVGAGGFVTVLGSGDSTLHKSGFIHIDIGAALVSGATIAPVAVIHHVTGNSTITNISVPWVGFSGTILLVPDGAFTWNAAGNIFKAGAAIVGIPIPFTFNSGTQKWYPGTGGGASGTFTTADAKTVTVVGGVITSIV